MCNISLGTSSGTIFYIKQTSLGVDENNALHSFAHADGHYHLMGCMLSAASCNKWWNERDFKDKRIFAAEQAGITNLGENRILSSISDGKDHHNNPDARARCLSECHRGYDP